MRLRPMQAVTLALGLTIVTGCADRLPADPSCVAADGAAAWACLSDAQLLSEIARAGGVVLIGFKEAGSVRGVDPSGRNLTSDATRASVTRLLNDRGVRVSYAFQNIPAVVATFPHELALVRELRAHPNVDYLEPSSTGSFSAR